MDGKAERRLLGTSPCDNERIIALKTNAFRAYKGKSSELIPPGPRSRIGTIQLNWVSSAYCPNGDLLAFRRPVKAMGDSTAAGGARAHGAGGVHPASWGSQRGGGRAGGRLKPDYKVTIGGGRRPRLGGDVVTFEDMREFLVAYLEYEQQLHCLLYTSPSPRDRG